MRPVYIHGVGIISRCACSAGELADICAGRNYSAAKGKLDFKTDILPEKLRRCGRYGKLAAAAAELARADGGIPDNAGKTGIGVIISTGYGAAESNIRFSDSVARGNPSLCSPAVFSRTVPNSCVGQICVINGYKGVSTLLMGGDPFEYSALLLNTERADMILAGSVEEYSEELADSLTAAGNTDGVEISEGAAVFALSGDETTPRYCGMTNFGSVSLGRYPYVRRADGENAVPAMAEAIKAACGEKIPDAVFTSENGGYFDGYERQAVKAALGTVKCFAPKKIFGECLGCGYALSAALAAVSLKTGRLPRTGCGKPKSILVTGIDTVGNYCCAFLEV
ncbi:MAG: hypothetical protein NC192_05000 [Muribaculaceae bacterium]|nr:hypothetical protein [Muribaculaceae bacterium]